MVLLSRPNSGTETPVTTSELVTFSFLYCCKLNTERQGMTQIFFSNNQCRYLQAKLCTHMFFCESLSSLPRKSTVIRVDMKMFVFVKIVSRKYTKICAKILGQIFATMLGQIFAKNEQMLTFFTKRQNLSATFETKGPFL
jgi:hypothetical protein